MDFLIIFMLVLTVAAGVFAVIYYQSRKVSREQKNFERGLKMVPVLIHLPPPSEDVKSDSRDQRDVMDEVISQAQTMYNVIGATVTKGFKSRFYGQRHISFEIVAHDGYVRYYVVAPVVLLETVKQAVMAAYPTARLEEVEEINFFNQQGKISGTVGGEFTLKKEYSFPISTYKESKRDVARAMLNAMSSTNRNDGIGLQILLRPADAGWDKKIQRRIRMITEGKRGASSGSSGIIGGSGVDLGYFGQILESLWKPPSASGDRPKDTNGAVTDKQLSGSDKEKVDAMNEKMRYAGYEALVRVIVSSPTAVRAQALLGNVVSTFVLFDSPTKNGFQFTPAQNMENLVTSYIFRFFPPEIKQNILNTVELATIFHLPDQNSIPSSAVERQSFKQVDGPSERMDDGLFIGYNVFRGVKKPIRLMIDDRRRHIYIMGKTGMGKSVLLENLALQNMLDGEGLAFIDPHGDSADNLLAMVPKERVEDVIYFNPSDMNNPIGLNMFEIDANDPDPERTKDYLITSALSMLHSLYDPNNQGIVGPRMDNIVRNAAFLLMDSPDGGTFMDIPKTLVDPQFTKSKIPYLKRQTAIDFWTKEWPDAQRSNDAGEVTSWVVSKWADFQNSMVTNILGQMKSALNFRDIMDNHKILLVNLSKGKMGEMPSKLIGMIFVMRFQAAAMARANVPEEQRPDFTMFVDEFQNFATESFESILSEARKYRLSLVVANQFMTQLTDKIRDAIIGNAGSFIIGRVGFEDAEQMVKMFQPTFDSEDLQNVPNHNAVAKILIHGMASQAFSLALAPPMGHPNQQLADALAKLSAAKYGHPRAQVEAEIKLRLNSAQIAAEKDKQQRLAAMRADSVGGFGSSNAHNSQAHPTASPKKSEFLDSWLQKRTDQSSSGTTTPLPKQLRSAPSATVQSTLQPQPVASANVVSNNLRAPVAKNHLHASDSRQSESSQTTVVRGQELLDNYLNQPSSSKESGRLTNDQSEISISLHSK